MKRKYLLTGASGFVGRNLLRLLLSNGYNISAVVRNKNWIDEMDKLLKKEFDNVLYNFYCGDLTNKDFVKMIFDKNDYEGIFHFAAQIPAEIRGFNEDFPIDIYIKNNNLATAQLLEIACQKKRKLKFVFASTISVFGKVEKLPIDENSVPCPVDVYGLTKLQCEQYIKYFAERKLINAIVLRYPGMIGVGNNYGAVYFYVSKCLKGEIPSVYGLGLPKKDYIYIDDVCRSALLAMERCDQFDYEVFNISGIYPKKEPLQLKEIATIVANAFRIKEVEINDRKPAEPINIYFNGRKAYEMLDFSPIPLEEAIKKYVDEMKKLHSK